MIRALIAAMMACACAGVSQAQEARRYDDLQMHTLVDGGERRSVGVYVPPSYQAGHPTPLIIALHGRYSSPKAFHALSGLRAIADARGAIIAYPQAAGAFWNDGGFAALGRRDTPHDDDAFITAVADALRNDYSIDRTRIFLVGYDSGGSMAYHLACRARLHVAGVAIVSALMWDYAQPDCATASTPTPMLIVHGRRDELFPVNGGAPAGPVRAMRLGVNDTLAVWRRINACNGPADANGRGGSALYTSCSAPIAYVGVDGGDHDWFRTGAGYQLNRQGVSTAALVDSFFFDRNAFALPTPRGASGRGRSYIVYVPPSYDATRPTPVVLVLHGRPSTASSMASISDMNSVAARHGFIAVYPQGVNNEWNVTYDLDRRRSFAPQDDVGFLEKLIDDLSVDLNVDRSRTYVSGFSNGGFMTLRLACTASNHFAAFASVGAELYAVLNDKCRGRAAPVLLMNGTADRSVSYAGVVVRDGQGREETTISLSAQRTAGFFISRNHCSFEGTRTVFAESGRSPGTHVVRFAPRDCAPGSEVMVYVIDGGGHNWPGVSGVLDEDGFGPTNMDINASEALWDFFQRQTLPSPPAS